MNSPTQRHSRQLLNNAIELSEVFELFGLQDSNPAKLCVHSSAFAALKSDGTHKCSDGILPENNFNGPPLQIIAELAEIKIAESAEIFHRTCANKNEMH